MQQNTIFPFCFPEGDAIFEKRSVLKEPTQSEFFTFMLTQVDGSRKSAYCIRFPYFEDPECLCIIGSKPLTHLFKEIMQFARKLRLISYDFLFKYLDDICLQQIPEPNEVLRNIKFNHLYLFA